MRRLINLTIRNFVRKPITNLINLAGLAVSLALVIILSVYSYSELTTDNYHKNGDRVYMYGDLNKGIYTPAILKEHIDLSVPGVESTVRMASAWEAPTFQVGNNDPITSDLVFADEDFFKLFTYLPVEGNLESALKVPMSVVITTTLSEKLFGSNHSVGRIMKMNNDKELIVSAVIEVPKANSCLSFSAIASVETRKIVLPNGDEFKEWGWCNFQTFVLLKKGVSPDETGKKILA
ncbi:MAG TPA: ABC transporter permease, partial [Prolixibacteraceae bacterium]